MNLLKSLLSHLFSKVLVYESVFETASVILQNNEYIPTDIKDSDVLLLTCQKQGPNLRYQVSGLYITKEEKYAKIYDLNAESLPNIQQTADIQVEIVPEKTWQFTPRNDSKVYFTYNSCLWTQNTIIEQRYSYILQDILQKRNKLFFSKGVLTINKQENIFFKKTNVCKSIVNFIYSHKI